MITGDRKSAHSKYSCSSCHRSKAESNYWPVSQLYAASLSNLFCSGFARFPSTSSTFSVMSSDKETHGPPPVCSCATLQSETDFFCFLFQVFKCLHQKIKIQW